MVGITDRMISRKKKQGNDVKRRWTWVQLRGIEENAS